MKEPCPLGPLGKIREMAVAVKKTEGNTRLPVPPVAAPDRVLTTLSIGVMLYNEAATVRPLVERLHKTLSQAGIDYDILLVDDGSTDGSREAVDALAAENPRVRALHHERNLGIGMTLRDCYQHTRGDAVAVLPADLQFAPEDVPVMWDALRDADVVNVTRRVRRDPSVRKIISMVDRVLVRLLFGVRIRDLHWVKLYRRTLLNAITITSTSPMVDTELLVKSHRHKARIAEIELPHYPRTAGRSTGASLKNLVRTFGELVRLWWTMRK